MAQRPEHERSQTNGLAKDINLQATAREMEKTAAREMEKHPVLQGYLLLGTGIALILFSLGFFPALKWVIFAGGLALAVWGTAKSHLIETLGDFFESLRKRF